MTRFERVVEFLFRADSDEWVRILRIGLAAQVIFYTWCLRRDWTYMLGSRSNGFLGRELSEALISRQSPFIPRLGWLISLCQQFGGSEAFALNLAWGCLFGAACLLLVGLCSRPAAIFVWLLYLASTKSGNLLSYGVDNFTIMGLFYLMLAPLPDRYCLDRLIWPFRAQNAHILGFHRRVLQSHLCFIYFFAGLAKCLGGGWWDGSNLWRSLTSPPFDLLSTELLISMRFILAGAGILVCIIETSYPLLIWPHVTRWPLLISVCLVHLAIALLMGMYLFGFVMLVLNLAAFGPPEPQRYASAESIRPSAIRRVSFPRREIGSTN